MSKNIPFEIQVEIIKRLPVRSVIQFRSVSRTWKSLIDSSEFVADYSRHQHTQRQHILVRYDDLTDRKQKYVSIVDDDTFPHNRVSLPRMREYYRIIGCSNGLFCLYHVARDGNGKAVLWNPSIRKTVDFVRCNVADGETYDTVLGFGVCRVTNDPKIVKITHIVSWSDTVSASGITWQVEVFTLSTRAWRRLGGNLPHTLVYFHFGSECNCPVVIDGVMYWFVTDWVTMDGGSSNLIISFDITSEEFGEINLPDTLAYPQPRHWFCMFKLRESLAVLENVEEANRRTYDVWMMEGGIQKSFTKLSTFDYITQDYLNAMGFRKSGEHIIEIIDGDRGCLVVYEPHSKHISNLGIDGVFCTSSLHPYMETLFLLDQPGTLNIQED